MELETPYHWFVANSLYWHTDDRLHVAIQALLSYGGIDDQYAVWRVPGTNADTRYKINFYTPQIEGAELVGVVNVEADDE